jgi:hypothetical protein
MPIFLNETEKQAIIDSDSIIVKRFRKALEIRTKQRANSLSLLTGNATTQWWYPVAEYLSDSAMQYALKPSETLGEWLRSTTLSIARRPTYDWVGPWFREHSEPFVGNLETAHLCWGVAAVLDLAENIFQNTELEEVKSALQEKGIVLCRRWLLKNNHLANWRGIMASGALVASAVLENRTLIEEFLPQIQLLTQAFQPDGSYGESLQYGNYLANALMLAYESLARKYPEYAGQIDIESYAKGMFWVASSMLYSKPIAAWGDEPRARAANFNDSAAIFRPSGDLLLHISARLAEKELLNAGLARWLFQEYYEEYPLQAPHNLATFGMVNDWGFLTLPLLTQASNVISPADWDLPLTQAFSNGNTFVRDKWQGNSVLAIQAGINDGCYTAGHLQGDLNSFILAYKKERLLIDAGHSCYRNLIHGIESSTQTHNTCTFLIENEILGLQEDLAKIKLLEQKNVLPRRKIIESKPSAPIERGGKLIHCERLADISLVVSEVAASYGKPVEEFTRSWVQIGSHLTFVIDRIRASEPVRTVWNWLVNNRDEKTFYESHKNQLTVYRHQVGMKLFNTNYLNVSGVTYAYAHDAYHPEPNQLGEGKTGSGLLFRFTDSEKRTQLLGIQVIAVDELALIDDYKVKIEKNEKEKQIISIQNPNEEVSLEIQSEFPLSLALNRLESVIKINEKDGKFKTEML